MKTFLGIDITDYKQNTRQNGERFAVAHPSLSVSEGFEAATARATGMLEDAKLPLPLRVVQWVCGVASALLGISLLKALSKVTIDEAYHNAPPVFWILGVCVVVWAVLKLIGSRKKKAVLDRQENVKTLEQLESAHKAVMSELGVPEDAREADLLTFFYKEKNGKIKVRTKGIQMTPYINPSFKVFADAERLYIADVGTKWAFPLSSLKAIRTVKKNVMLAQWNKDIGYTDEMYRPYKFATAGGCLHTKWYHILEVDDGGEPYGIWLPCYECPLFEELTGLTAQPPTKE